MTVGTQRLHAAERRAQLLDVTASIVAEAGFHGLTIGAVARRAGVSRPVVYEHFGDLPGLVDALVDRLANRALGQLAAVLPEQLHSEPREALLAALQGYLEAARADPITWRLVLIPPEGAPAPARQRVATGRAEVVAQLAAAVRPAIESTGLPPDAELTAHLLVTVADELVRLVLTDPDTFTVERVLRHAGWVLAGLEAAHGRAAAAP